MNERTLYNEKADTLVVPNCMHACLRRGRKQMALSKMVIAVLANHSTLSKCRLLDVALSADRRFLKSDG